MEDADKKLPNGPDNYLSIEPIGSNKEEQVSWQVLQAFYNYITGKTECLKNSYELPIQISLNDLIHLNNVSIA